MTFVRTLRSWDAAPREQDIIDLDTGEARSPKLDARCSGTPTMSVLGHTPWRSGSPQGNLGALYEDFPAWPIVSTLVVTRVMTAVSTAAICGCGACLRGGYECDELPSPTCAGRRSSSA